ncbi:helix-turn-helix domain-containing protein [Streptomyces sp. MBT49]|uniref:helix-turn-helix transcriptional regulator n=1 Tax=unclassified Streptomyces TaxID=2593676 RepID=UPI00190D7750|nr:MULTISPECIES: helix-turn-helix transcriptional regulator [unclassified Streptomyces]MBK3626307.1 helix-turn-helix domain-containing protein [Streptomyces sp. MBT49]MBK3635766.1 helix-turn-helix domain-containing protein [Streptomyces sp. MBT97]
MEFQQEIRGFLMSRRARITPEQAGLPYVGGNRRVEGLRREEVAMLAGLSVEYYTRMERGQLGGASESVLDAVARALRLDEDERAHLYDLARSVAPGSRRERPRRTSPVTASVQQVLDSMSVPAVVQNGRLDLLAANALGRALYTDLFDPAGQPPNIARYVFLDPRAEDFYADVGEAKDQLVAVLRATAGRDPLDRQVTRLVGELSLRSPDFATRWARHDVRRHSRGRKVVHHPAVGTMDLAYDDFALPGDPHVSITTYTADPGTPGADGLALLASWAEARERPRPGRDDTARPPV